MEFDLRIGPRTHLPTKNYSKDTRQEPKTSSNSISAVIYPENSDPSDVIRSLRVIINDLELHAAKGEP
jgi:hypothetical protein